MNCRRCETGIAGYCEDCFSLARDAEALLAEAEKALACCACDEEGMRGGPQNYGHPRVPCECGRRAIMERLRGRKFEVHP